MEYFPNYDANGNITAYSQLDQQETQGADKENNQQTSIAARFDYSPFGSIAKQTVNNSNVEKTEHRLSTKPLHEVSGLTYYKYRAFSNKRGNFISFDSIEETKGEREKITLDDIIAVEQKMLSESSDKSFLEMTFNIFKLRERILAEDAKLLSSVIIKNEVINMTLFVRNNPIDKYDYLGLHTVADCETAKEACDEGCRKIGNAAKRALCWAGCMSAYSGCLATAEETIKCCCVAATGAAVVVAVACPFDGPAGDAVAIGAFCAAVNQ